MVTQLRLAIESKMIIPVKYYILLLCSFFVIPAFSQIAEEDLKSIQTYEDSMIVDAFLVVNDTMDFMRFESTKNLIIYLKEGLKYKNSFQYPFERLKSISIQYAPDNSFRIFTWQLKVTEEDYRYFGAIQMNTPEIQLVPLSDRSFEITETQEAVLNPRNWYGALYYNIQHITQNDKDYYLLLGYDAYSQRDRRKVLEVLSFEENQPQFGAPIIPVDTMGNYVHRLLLQYHNTASVRLNYDEAKNAIFYDHLITIPSRDGSGPIQVADGSYAGLKLDQGQMKYIDKLFNNQAVDDAPRETPVLVGRKGKDLFGRQRKKN